MKRHAGTVERTARSAYDGRHTLVFVMGDDGGMPIAIGRRPDHTFDEPLGLLSDCHRRIELFLRTLGALAAESFDAPLTEARRVELEAALTYFATAAPRHTADEEESVFPRLRRCADEAAARALQTVARLEHDHAEAAAHHAAVDAIGRRWLADGALSAEDRRTLRAHVAALELIYREHIAIEDRELFPAAARLLDAAEIREIGREMRARRAVTRATAPPASTRP
jgi:hemerythrin-like domain-containing protein